MTREWRIRCFWMTARCIYIATADDLTGPWLYSMDLDRRVPRRVNVSVEQYISIAASAASPGRPRRLVADGLEPQHEPVDVPIAKDIVDESAASRVRSPPRTPRVRASDTTIWSIWHREEAPTASGSSRMAERPNCGEPRTGLWPVPRQSPPMAARSVSRCDVRADQHCTAQPTTGPMRRPLRRIAPHPRPGFLVARWHMDRRTRRTREWSPVVQGCDRRRPSGPSGRHGRLESGVVTGRRVHSLFRTAIGGPCR